MSEDVDRELRLAWKALGEKPDRNILKWPTYPKASYLGKLRQRIAAMQQEAERARAKQSQHEAEDDIPPGPMGNGPGPLGHDCGGGTRVIRSTRHLGG